MKKILLTLAALSLFAILIHGVSAYSCTPGQFYNSTSNTCDLCPTGTFQALANQTSCDLCPSGTISTSGSTQCINAPIDCQVSAWSSFSACTVPICGGGIQTRTRTVLVQPQYGGAACPPLTESVVCNTHPCAVNCQMSNWSNWTTCSTTCGEGIQTRNRTIIQQPQLGGLPCGNLTETQTCNTQLCPVDCQVGNWSSWSSCSVTCGNGTQTRTRNIAINASNGGIACPTLLENQTCNMPACTTNNSQCTDNYPRWNHDSEEDHFTWNRKIFSDFQEKTNPFQRIRTNFFSRFWNSFRR